MDEEKKYQLENFVAEMKAYRARHTELITVYVPKGYDLNLVTRQLESEKSTAANIKSTATRKNVQDALESMIRQIKLIGRNLKNGVALFAGNVSQVEGQDNFIVKAYEPPEEMNARLYRCDQTFVLDPLEEMLEIKEVYGLVVIERKEATIGLLIGKKIKVLQKMSSGVPGKVRAGGQCLSPDTIIETKKGYKKIIEVNISDQIKALNIFDNKVIFTKVTNKWIKNKPNVREFEFENNSKIIASRDHLFFKKENDKLKEVIAHELLPGDILIKSEDGNLIDIEIFDMFDNNNETKLVDIETEEGNFFANNILVHNSAARYHRVTEGLAKEFYRRISERVKEEFFDLKTLKGILVGGPGPTKEDFLKEGQLVTALVDKIIAVKDIGYADEHGLDLLVEGSQDILSKQEIIYEKKLLERFFNMLGKEREKTAYRKEEVEKALSYGAVDVLLLSKKLKKEEITYFEELGRKTSVKIELVSNETEEGVQFLNLSGIGAILRFKIG